MSGFVSLVSAGPGDPELLTLKAVDRLQRADAVLFDDFCSGPILSHARSGADLVSVGKRVGRASPKQDHVNRLLIDYALSGARVVRLKSGDAGIFGRLEEEIAALAAERIHYEIIPGVTAASAAAAAAGIALTRRLIARRVQFVAGHDVTGGLPEGLNMAALADPQATTVVYMGRRTFAQLSKRLIAADLPANTPALLAVAISHPEQRLVMSTIGELQEKLSAEDPEAALPALILYGALVPEVVATNMEVPGTE